MKNLATQLTKIGLRFIAINSDVGTYLFIVSNLRFGVNYFTINGIMPIAIIKPRNCVHIVNKIIIGSRLNLTELECIIYDNHYIDTDRRISDSSIIELLSLI